MADIKGLQTVSTLEYPSNVNLTSADYGTNTLVTKGYVGSAVHEEVMNVVKRWAGNVQIPPTGGTATFEHNIGSADVVVQVYKIVNGVKQPILVSYEVNSSNVVSVTFPPTDEEISGYSVIIMGAVFSNE